MNRCIYERINDGLQAARITNEFKFIPVRTQQVIQFPSEPACRAACIIALDRTEDAEHGMSRYSGCYCCDSRWPLPTPYLRFMKPMDRLVQFVASEAILILEDEPVVTLKIVQ
jgi:hypothetical protein